MEYKWVGNHSQDLASGRMLEPGETVELSDEDASDPHNKSLIDDGGLMAIGSKTPAGSGKEKSKHNGGDE